MICACLLEMTRDGCVYIAASINHEVMRYGLQLSVDGEMVEKNVMFRRPNQ